MPKTSPEDAFAQAGLELDEYRHGIFCGRQVRYLQDAGLLQVGDDLFDRWANSVELEFEVWLPKGRRQFLKWAKAFQADYLSVGDAQIEIIACMARNGVIGSGGAMPWGAPIDGALFRRLTSDCPVIMGRRTWESLPEEHRPLYGRTNIVISTTMSSWLHGCIVARNFNEAVSAAIRTGAARVCVIGGGEVYREAFPHTVRVHLSVIPDDHEGDTLFPIRLLGSFELSQQSAHDGYTYQCYERKK